MLGTSRKRKLTVAGLAALGFVGLAAPANAENYRLVKTYGSPGAGDGQFANPGGAVIGSEGTQTGPRETLIVADTTNNRIQVLYADDGAFLRKWGTLGSGNTELSDPAGIARDSVGNLWVADSFNDRIKQFNSTGLVTGGWGSVGSGDGQFRNPLRTPRKGRKRQS